MTYRHVTSALRLAWFCLLVWNGWSCAGRRSSTVSPEQKITATDGKVVAEAYLFDAVLKQRGKTNSFRLEMYATDSVVGLAGRGYLGKGALSGVASKDSLKVYFPSTNEFVDDSHSSILSTGDCALTLPHFDPVRLMFVSPDSLALDSGLNLDQISSDRDRSVFRIRGVDCRWSLELTYRRTVAGWRPVELRYDDGRGTTLTAVRREYQPRARVPRSRFGFSHPVDAHRIDR
ncbi:MAG: hypothetical protein HY851_08155 [candidate division Zixibacteria bacterium]|nr:hypothetical protein [candidate division Zixibacteria bacterium]